MKKEIEFVEIQRSEEVENMIVEGFDKLGERYNWITTGIAYLKQGHGTPDTAIVELEIHIPGEPLFVKEENEKLPKAIHDAFNVVKRLLEKRKDQVYSHR